VSFQSLRRGRIRLGANPVRSRTHAARVDDSHLLRELVGDIEKKASYGLATAGVLYAFVQDGKDIYVLTRLDPALDPSKRLHVGYFDDSNRLV
jgi:hypothetical protein